MEIIRGSLDNISRPASSEQKGNRVCSVPLPHFERTSPTTPFSLVVLTNDASDQSSNEEIIEDFSERYPDEDSTAENDEEHKLQAAMEEMKRLDEILSEKISQERETRLQSKKLRAKLWQELQLNKPAGHSESAHEVLNTQQFLALETLTDAEEEEDFPSVFETQVPDCEPDADDQRLEPSENGPGSWTEAWEVDFSHSGSFTGKNKHKNFVRRNIELVSGEGGRALLTEAERERLAELLREIEEEEEDEARDGEGTTWAVSVLSGQVYTPEPSDLDQLIDIDSKIRLLLPEEESHSAQASYTNLSVCQGWKCDGDSRPGEKVLQDIKERRGLERRLLQIQRQLEILGGGQEMTEECAELSEEQLLTLLDGCELTEREPGPGDD
ncbi:fibrous sheath-interacting protein 1 [Salarias fasciatus]|uniref:fibrous sheath-interacting protein 1 n=1 Tax=Salarias fasciatus TaxID=181472 RepID=UPI001176A034|nr:fibrous sheath-interacting protein 1 [Salarias fasciatus]